METGLGNSKALADQLTLLVEGAIAYAHATGSAMPAVQAREAAWSLIKNAKR